MKSLGQIEIENAHAAALARNPDVLEKAIAWLEDMTEEGNENDAIGGALAELLREWREEPYDVALIRSGFAGRLAYLYDYELSATS